MWVVATLAAVAACAGGDATETTEGETTTSESAPSTTTTSTTTTTTTTTTIPTTTVTAPHPVLQAIAGIWRTKTGPGWADFEIFEHGVVRATNPQADDLEVFIALFTFDDEIVTVGLGHSLWPSCESQGTYTWDLEDEDTLRFSLVEHECRPLVGVMTNYVWVRQD